MIQKTAGIVSHPEKRYKQISQSALSRQLRFKMPAMFGVNINEVTHTMVQWFNSHPSLQVQLDANRDGFPLDIKYPL